MPNIFSFVTPEDKGSEMFHFLIKQKINYVVMLGCVLPFKNQQQKRKIREGETLCFLFRFIYGNN